MGDEVVEQQETTPEEIAQLRLQAQEVERLKGQLASAQQTNTQQTQDMARLNQYAQEAIARLSNPQQQPNQEPEDEETVRLRQRIQQEVQTNLAPHQQASFQNNRAIQRETAKLKYGEDFVKYETEIENLLNGYPPNVSSAPGAYDAAVQAVKAMHVDEIIADKVRIATEASQVPKKPGAISPQRNATGRAQQVKQEESESEGPWTQLPEGDKEFLTELGFNDKDYNQYQGNDYTEDIFGFKGRDRV